MSRLERLQDFISSKELEWALYVCQNSGCKNSIGDSTYEIAIGIKKETATEFIKCTKCGSDMKKAN